eukprot:360047-Chlamydomonas_euryale.AAC.2
MKSASHGDHQVACIVPGSVPAAMSARPCVQCHRLLSTSERCHCTARPSAGHDDGRHPRRARSRRNIGIAVDALARGWVDCLDAFRPGRSAKL